MSHSFQDQVELQEQKQTSISYMKDDLSSSARHNFVKKVYSILTMQLVITFAICLVSLSVRQFFEFQLNNPAVLWISFALLLVIEIAILCTSLGRTFPANILLLLGFTLCQSYSLSYICSIVAQSNGAQIVLIAAVMTLAIFLSLTAYACLTKTDFTIKNGIMVTVLTSMIMLMFITMLTNSSFMNNILCTLGAIVFGIYIIIDTQLIMGNGKYQITMDDYILAALVIYIDIIQIFLYIVRLLSRE